MTKDKQCDYCRQEISEGMCCLHRKKYEDLKKALWVLTETRDVNPALERAWREETDWLHDFLKE